MSGARREIGKLTESARAAVQFAIDGLAVDPRPPGARELAGSPVRYRIRVGDYRVIYEVRDETLLILVVKVGHRRNVYKGE